jgi:hypothetical protein
VGALRTTSAAAVVLLTVVGGTRNGILAQREPPLSSPLESMVETERRFAVRAMQVGWKDAFLEFFSDAAVGFADGAVGYAKDQIRARPDPPAGHQLLREPRWGDISASGELGYLTGPSRSVLPNDDGRGIRSTRPCGSGSATGTSRS